MFTVWAVNASLFATPATSLISLPFTSNGPGSYRLVLTTAIEAAGLTSVTITRH